MKNKNGFTVIELLTVLAIIIGLLFMCFRFIGGCRQIVTKKFGGSMTVNLDPGTKLVNITWKDDHLWVLTEAKTNGEPKTYHFSEKSTLGILQGDVTIVEK